ncbi:MAG: hypothetical protein KAT05_06850, partial [Spirochaetes bacterium]|nr:hypothetical protein [Spirochaetota bacterium]
NIELEEIIDILKKLEFNKKNYDKQLSETERQKVKNLLQSEEIKEIIRIKKKSYQKSTIGYLMQEGLSDKKKYGLIDIGWNGTLQRSISRLLDMKGYDLPIVGLYFGIRSRKKHKDSDKMFAFFSDYQNPHWLEKLIYIVPMMEIFVAADHGGVGSYKKINNKYQPVFKNSSNIEGIKWGISIQQEAMEFLANTIIEHLNNFNKFIYNDFFAKNMSMFILSPSIDEARVYGSYPLSEEQNEAYHLSIAAKYNLWDLFFKKDSKKHHHNEWVNASYVLSNNMCKYFFRLRNKKLKYVKLS